MSRIPRQLNSCPELVLMELAERYQLITATAAERLHQGRFHKEFSVETLLKNMAKEGRLRKIALSAKSHGFVPISHRCSKPLSRTTKLRSLAMLNVCANAATHRTRLTVIELEKYFPEISRPGLPMNYYIEITPKQPRMGFLRVDTGGSGRWDRIVAKSLNDARKHYVDPVYQRFIERGALEIRVVTALPQKANRIARALRDKPTALAQAIRISVVPELLNLIAPLPV